METSELKTRTKHLEQKIILVTDRRKIFKLLFNITPWRKKKLTNKSNVQNMGKISYFLDTLKTYISLFTLSVTEI